MSLLLDALKKAAEQKARQAKAGSEDSAADQHKNEFSDTDETQLQDDTVISEDETIEYEEQTEVINDDTDFVEDRTLEVNDIANITEDEGDDTKTYSDTDVFRQQDTPTYLQDSEFREDATHLPDDGEAITDIDTSKDETQYGDMTDHKSITEINERAEHDLTESTVIDDTVINQEDRTEFTRTVAENISRQDEVHDTVTSSIDIDSTEPVLTGRDISDFLEDSEGDTDVNEDDSISDMSLMLVNEHDDTTQYAQNNTITTGPHASDFSKNPDTENLRIVEGDDESATKTSAITADQNETVTTGIELESLRHEHTVIRPEVTSTHSYAPDNYDRTLIRPPNDDASKIFAGMKADDDVLMTPDYAKRVFLSKSTANRLQHYKIYLGIAISVLLATGIYSMFEVMDEYQRIDSAMLSLKRDPMPGIIQKPKNRPDQVDIQPQVDMQTLKLVENAQTAVTSEETQIEDSVTSDRSEVSDENTSVNQNVESGGTADKTESIDSDQSADQIVASTTLQQMPVESIVARQPSSNTIPQSSGSLQISSSSRLSDIDQWLLDAYTAYQRGDDATALQKYAQVLKQDPLNRNALLARAAIKVQNGKMASAITDYQLILHANPKDSLAMSSLISIARTAPRESETQLKLMIRDEPDSPHLNFALGNVYGSQNRWQEAQRLYFKALRSKPEDPNYAYNLAVSLEHMSQPEAAITYYEMAVENITNGLATFNKELVNSRIAMLKQL